MADEADAMGPPTAAEMAADDAAVGSAAAGGPAPAPQTGNVDVLVDSGDVIRLMLQFMRENGLSQSLEALQAETGLFLNGVEDTDAFLADITRGRWDRVLRQVATLHLPVAKLQTLQEQVVREMIELRELDTARALLRRSPALLALKDDYPERYRVLEHALTAGHYVEADLYRGGATKTQMRAQIAAELKTEISTAPPSRLLALIGQAMKWQQHQGLLPPGRHFNVFTATAGKVADEDEAVPHRLSGQVRFGAKSYAESAIFTPDGRYLLSGSVDGFVEVWDYELCKLDKSLPYQAEQKMMMHDAAVLAIAISSDSEFLAAATKTGNIKVWKISVGKCARKFLSAHTGAIVSIQFSKDDTQLLTGSHDCTARMHGLRSGRTLKEFSGHSSFVNVACFSVDGLSVITGSADGTLKIFDAKSAECLRTIRLPQTSHAGEVAVLAVIPVPRKQGQFLVCDRSSSLKVVSEQGTVLRAFATHPGDESNFACCGISPKGKWIYGVTEKHRLYSFDIDSTAPDSTVEISTASVVGIAHHPHRNILATFGEEGPLKLWVP